MRLCRATCHSVVVKAAEYRFGSEDCCKGFGCEGCSVGILLERVKGPKPSVDRSAVESVVKATEVLCDSHLDRRL